MKLLDSPEIAEIKNKKSPGEDDVQVEGVKLSGD